MHREEGQNFLNTQHGPRTLDRLRLFSIQLLDQGASRGRQTQWPGCPFSGPTENYPYVTANPP